MRQGSSFRPTQGSSVQIPFTRLSIHNGLLLTSSGIPSLDDVLGGGLPLGSLLLIKQDSETEYHSLLIKFFLAQGLVGGHGLSVHSLDQSPSALMNSLMGLSTSAQEALEEESKSDSIKQSPLQPLSSQGSTRQLGSLRSSGPTDSMKIAWRYQNQSQFSSSLTQSVTTVDQKYCTTFDLTKKMDTGILSKGAEKTMALELDPVRVSALGVYGALYEHIKKSLEQGRYLKKQTSSQASPRTLCRIAIDSFASGVWPLPGESQMNAYRFLMALRHLLRQSYAVCMISLPAYIYNDYSKVSSSPFIRQLEHACDAVIEIESFAGSPRQINPKYTSDYTGLFHPIRLPRMHSLHHMTRVPEVTLGSLGFKVQRKRFSIETFHLPPEEEEYTSTTNGNDNGSGTRVRRAAASLIPAKGASELF